MYRNISVGFGVLRNFFSDTWEDFTASDLIMVAKRKKNLHVEYSAHKEIRLKKGMKKKSMNLGDEMCFVT